MKEYKNEQNCLYYSGVPLVEYSLSLPVFNFGTSGDKKINETFSELFDNAKKSIDKLYERAKSEYENDGDEKKRFRWRPYKYALSYEEKDSDGEYLSFIITSRLSLRARVISEKKSAKVIRKRDGAVIPFSIVYGKGAKKLKRERKRQRKAHDLSNFYLSGKKIFLLFCENGRWRAEEIQKCK